MLVEYQNQFKANKFLDKRIGENDPKLTLEDKMFKRFERQRQKKNRYNLNEDEGNEMHGYNSAPKVDLTHYGQSLAQIEKFERVDLSDDDDEDDEDPNSDRGKINGLLSRYLSFDGRNNLFFSFKPKLFQRISSVDSKIKTKETRRRLEKTGLKK